MGVKNIPEQWRYTCDGCGNVATSDTSFTRPKYWTDLQWRRDAYDFQGQACASADVARMLCGGCTEILQKAINEAFEKTIGGGKID